MRLCRVTFDLNPGSLKGENWRLNFGGFEGSCFETASNGPNKRYGSWRGLSIRKTFCAYNKLKISIMNAQDTCYSGFDKSIRKPAATPSQLFLGHQWMTSIHMAAISMLIFTNKLPFRNSSVYYVYINFKTWSHSVILVLQF